MKLRNGLFCAFLPVVAIANDDSWKPEGSASLDLANAYIFRGATVVDSPVAQPYVRLQPWSGWSLGMWGNLALDSNRGRTHERELTEVDLLVSYSVPFDPLTATLGWVEYLYPHSDSGPDREVTLSVTANLPFSPTVTAFGGVDGGVRHEMYLEGAVGYEWAWFSEQLRFRLAGILAWRYSPERPTGFSHATIGLTIPYRVLAIGALWILQLDNRVLTDDDFDRPLLLTLSFRTDF